MSHVGYFITIEGVENILATEEFTGVAPWLNRTFLPCFEKSGMSPFDYSINPHKREADVGVISLQLVDKHGSGTAAAGMLTELFAVRASQPLLYLKDTIEQGDGMTGAGTVEVTGSLNAISFPTYFYIERETFYSLVQAAEKIFGGVSRASNSSRKARHIGYTDDNGYNPEVRLSVPSWKDRMAHVYRVVEEDVANATRWWSGPILDLSPSGVNTWSLRIGSVIRLLGKTIFDKPNQALTSELGVYKYTQQAKKERLPLLAVLTDVVRGNLALTSNTTKDANGLWAYSYCTALDEPDGFWNSQYFIRLLSGIAGPRFVIDYMYMPYAESGSPAVTTKASIANGTYDTADLCTAIALTMTTDSPNGYTYTCVLASSGHFEIECSGANTFILKWSTQSARIAAMLGWYAKTDTTSAKTQTAPNAFDADTQGIGVPIHDFDNTTHKLTHGTPILKGVDKLPSSGDRFSLVRSNQYPPSNIYCAFPAVIDDELVAVYPRAPYRGAFDVVRGIEIVANEVDGNVDAPTEAHAIGAPVVEILSNYRMDEDVISREAFGAASADDLPVFRTKVEDGIHSTERNPLLWFLELWHSTGEGWNGTYDVLHKEHGAGLPSSLIAATTIAAMADKIPTYRLGYKEPVSLKDIFVRDICIPCGLYPAIDASGKLSVKRLEQHDSDSTADLTITEGNIVKGSAQASQDHVGIVGRIQIEHGWNPADGTFREVFDSGLTDVEYWYPESKPDKHECNIWPLAAEPGSNSDAVRKNVLGAHAIRVLTRVGFPKVMLSLSVPLSADTLPARPGDLAKVTLDGPCPLPTNTRTLSGEWFEIHAVEIDPLGSSIRLDLFWLGWYRGKFSKWNLGAAATAWHAATKRVTVATTTFQTGEDCADYVATGDKIRVHYVAAARKGSGVYGDTEEMTVDSVSGYVIQFTGAPTNAIVAGDVIACCDYNSATAEQKKRAFLAEDPDVTIIGEETVGSAGDNPYVYG